MVFFNYSTMQMAAKIVYYGPGLCGKTTNLQHIYGRTSDESRGEMVSLETETDRTLFFDLLPIDVGSIAGFNTRIQLYTVPGQVFYNTTRKLVLKGVDGVVFVADSQKAMLQANRDSFNNLDENLAEMGLSIQDIPMVLQFNKRDLPDICSVGELNTALNPDGKWVHYEASAINGQGVFETLKGISKQTLMSLKQRLTRTDTAKPVAKTTAQPVSPPASQPTAQAESAKAEPAATEPASAGAAPRAEAAQAAAKAPSPSPRTTPAPSAPETPTRAAAKRKSRDVMGELEKLTVEHTRSGTSRRKVPARRNGSGELTRSLELNLERADFERVRSLSVRLQVEDADRQVVEEVEELRVDVSDPSDLQKVLLRLQVALSSRG